MMHRGLRRRTRGQRRVLALGRCGIDIRLIAVVGCGGAVEMLAIAVLHE
jgi:hypothetical protein